MGMELFIAALAVFVWAATGPGTLHALAYNMMLVASVSTVVFNINPLMRFDGYYILSDLLDYARPRAPEFHATDLNATAERAVSLARQQVLSRPIQIELITGRDLDSVGHDPAQIQQVLLNLLLNGIQALDGKGQIRVELASEDEFALIRVRDTGKGIAPEKLANIFRPFYTTKGGGTGLGLSLSRRIVESHGGKIEVASTPGQGTEFTVRLPLRKVTVRQAVS